MRTWLSFLLPKDEYKQNRIVYFFAEGGILLFLSLIIMIVIHNFITLTVELVMLIAVVVFSFYVFGRYIFSGIEYADVATEKAYKKEIKNILVKTSIFLLLFFIGTIMIIGLPSSIHNWFDTLFLAILTGFLWFITSFVSLKRSYKKNKELL